MRQQPPGATRATWVLICALGRLAWLAVQFPFWCLRMSVTPREAFRRARLWELTGRW